MSETQIESKYDVGYTYKAQLVNGFDKVEVEAVGCRTLVEKKIKEWVPTLMNGDTIRFTRMDKE